METNLGLAIKSARVSANFTSGQLAERVNVSPKLIGLIESGIEPVSDAMVTAVATALDMPVWALRELGEQASAPSSKRRELKRAQKELIKAALAIRHGGN